MKNLCFGLLALSSFLFTSCNDGANHQLSSKDSMDIYNAIAERPDVASGKPCPPVSVYDGDSHSLIITEEYARRLHQSYLKGNMLPIQFGGKYVRFFNVPGDDVEKMTATPDFAGLRVYFGFNDTTKKYHLVMTGVNSKGENNLTALSDEFKPCPDQCSSEGDTTDLNFDRVLRKPVQATVTNGN